MRIVNESAKREGIDVRTEIWREYYQDASYGYAETFDKLRVSAQHEFSALNVSFVPGWYFLPLGRQDINVGNTSVDDRYIIKSPHPEVIVQYFDADLYQLLLDTYDAHAVSALELHVSDGTVSVGAAPSLVGRINEAVNNVVAPIRPVPSLQELPLRVNKRSEAAALVVAVAQRPQMYAAAWHRILGAFGHVTGPAVLKLADAPLSTAIVAGNASNGRSATAFVIERGAASVALELGWQSRKQRTFCWQLTARHQSIDREAFERCVQGSRPSAFHFNAQSLMVQWPGTFTTQPDLLPVLDWVLVQLQRGAPYR